jgi:hypothetical protein
MLSFTPQWKPEIMSIPRWLGSAINTGKMTNGYEI